MNAVEGVADAVENQANADRDATLSDRLKMAGMYKLNIPHDMYNNYTRLRYRTMTLSGVPELHSYYIYCARNLSAY